MKISYNWLKDYIKVDLVPNKLAEILTDIGLEVEGIDTVETVKGGLNGLVIGEVKSVSQHPNADRLNLTKIEVGHADLLDIVCGAPNVAEGQKVVVALVGATLYSDDKEFKIKKSKIRGEVSEGMLCAEDEIGLGNGHDGIMVLDTQAKVGQAAAEYFDIKTDTVFEIGLTPNRVDAASHYGVARDLAAYLNIEDQVELQIPAVADFESTTENLTIDVSIESNEDCRRYTSVAMTDVKVGDSPDWLKNRLLSVGLKPINNVVDSTNYVLHELGQPLHAFDTDKIEGGKVLVKKAEDKSIFTTLDAIERTLSREDLMICNTKEPMCIAGVFGGIKSGVDKETTSIFLESAYFNPVTVRKTAKRHGLNTDASFRFERGVDPNITLLALKRVVYLIQELTGGKVSSNVSDIYPNPIEDFLIDFNFENCDRLIGYSIDRNTIKKIITNLEIDILDETKKSLRLSVPAYRVDVQREVDVIEEVLRIYGYNHIPLPSFMKSSISSNNDALNPTKIENTIANYLSNNGFSEIFNNSLTSPIYYQEQDSLVKMLNPLSSELEVMRQSMLYGGLETIAYNQNRKKKNLKLYEFGRTYKTTEISKFEETKRLAVWLSGNQFSESWQEAQKESDVFLLKELVLNCLGRLGISKFKLNDLECDTILSDGIELLVGKHSLVYLGEVSQKKLRAFGIKEKVYFAEFNWNKVLEMISTNAVQLKPIAKFPSIRRDLALLIDEKVQFDEIKRIVKSSNPVLKEINLFDVYEGNKISKGKKSYGVSMTFQDPNKTLTDKYIDKVTDKIIAELKSELGAELR